MSDNSGLVISVKAARSEPGTPKGWGSFPDARSVADAADLLGAFTPAAMPTHLVRIGPALLQLVRRIDEPHIQSAQLRVARGQVSSFSRASQRNLIRKVSVIDWAEFFQSGRVPAMVTLTLPGAWLEVAPTGAHFKSQIRAFRERYKRAWGEPLNGLWKLEFQRRGAPHLHIFMLLPIGLSSSRTSRAHGLQFPTWLSLAWAEVVGVTDPREFQKHLAAGTAVDVAKGINARDPKRIAIYFLKHSLNSSSEKFYQNVVPEQWSERGKGPGRFWGAWGLEDCSRTVPVDQRAWLQLARLLRRYASATINTRVVTVPRSSSSINPYTGEVEVRVQYRRVTRRSKRMQRGAGFQCLADSPHFVQQAVRWIEAQSADARPPPCVTE